MATQKEINWRQRAVIYEIAPISFQDSNADGKGDLRGLLSRITPISGSLNIVSG